MDYFTGSQYLKIDIANNFGLDKKDWDVRIKWFDDNEHVLMDLMPKAENPALFFAGIQAWTAYKHKVPFGYPISLDATSSGAQILAVLTGDRQAAELCNVVDTGTRENLYDNIYKLMLAEVGGNSKIKSEDIKRSIMTSLYGSIRVPKEVFGEGELYDAFQKVMTENLPVVWELNQIMLDIWDPTVDIHSWIMPDNFHVNIKVITQIKDSVNFLDKPYDVFRKVNAPKEDGRSLGANLTHSVDGFIVRELTRRCSFDPVQIGRVWDLLDNPVRENTITTEATKMVDKLWTLYQESGYLSARILDYLDETNVDLVDRLKIRELIHSLPMVPFQVIAVHDCFRVLPNYGNDLRKQYNLQLALISKSTMLQHILTNMLKRPVTLGKSDPTLWTDVLHSNYALS